MTLVVCPRCRRHVRDADATCPFCTQRMPGLAVAAAALVAAQALTGCHHRGAAEVYGPPPANEEPAPEMVAVYGPPPADSVDPSLSEAYGPPPAEADDPSVNGAAKPPPSPPGEEDRGAVALYGPPPSD